MCPRRVVGIFWDLENLRPPREAAPAYPERGFAIASRIRKAAQEYGCVKQFFAYSEFPEQSSMRSQRLRSALTESGVTLKDCAHNARKEVVDKYMIVDMLAFAMDNPADTEATIVLITNDHGFMYAISILRARKYHVVVIATADAYAGLRYEKEFLIDWDDVIIGDMRKSSPSRLSPSGGPPPIQIDTLQPPARHPYRLRSSSDPRDRHSTSVGGSCGFVSTPSSPQYVLVPHSGGCGHHSNSISRSPSVVSSQFGSDMGTLDRSGSCCDLVATQDFQDRSPSPLSPRVHPKIPSRPASQSGSPELLRVNVQSPSSTSSPTSSPTDSALYTASGSDFEGQSVSDHESPSAIWGPSKPPDCNAFNTLVQVIKELSDLENERRIKRSKVGSEMRRRQDAYENSPYKSFKDLTLAAEQYKIVELGGSGGDAWIAVKDKHRLVEDVRFDDGF